MSSLVRLPSPVSLASHPKPLRRLIASAVAFSIALAAAVTAAPAQDRGLLAVQVQRITGNPSFDVGKQYAVIIGIDRYKEWPALRNAVAEAKSVKAVLASRYYIDEFAELYDGAATASAIRKLFTEYLPGKLKKEDSLFIFFAGHGHLDSSNTGFWIASDGVKDILDQRGWIANQQIRNYISTFKAVRILVVADACFSGDFVNVSRGAGPSVDSAYFAKALQLTARQVLTSGASETVPDESEFGRYFVTTLERNADAILDPYSMYERIRKSVTQTVPLLGTIPGNESGASFAFFLKPGFGNLSISAATGARVEIDGKDRGSVSPGKPLVVPELSAGPHDVRLAYPGAEERRAAVVKAGETVSESFAWKAPLSGRLAVSSLSDARVLVDGAIVGSVPGGKTLEVPELSAGEHVVTLQYADNQEDRRVQVYPGTLNAIAFTYRMESLASVSFEGFPDGAVVYSSGRELGAVAAGRFVARGLVPGPRIFSVYYERWAEPLSLTVTVSATAANTAAFQGGRILALSVPRDAQASVDGKFVAKGDGSRAPLDLGLYPAGPHTVTFSGASWETQRVEAVVKPGAESRVAAKMAIKPAPASAPSSGLAATGPKKPSSPSAGSGYGSFRIRNDSGLSEGLEVRLRKDGVDDSLTFLWDQANTLPAGRYVIEARRAGDPEWAFSSPFDIVPGGERTQSVPPIGYSVPWRIADLELKREAASLGFHKALAARETSLLVSDIGAAISALGFISFAVGIIDGFAIYPAYNAATTLTEASALHDRIVVDQHLWVFGSAVAGTAAIPWAFRFFGMKNLPRARDALRAIDEELWNLRNAE